MAWAISGSSDSIEYNLRRTSPINLVRIRVDNSLAIFDLRHIWT